MGESVEHEGALLGLDLGENQEILWGFVKSLTTDRAAVIQFGVHALVTSLEPLTDLLSLLLNLIVNLIMFIIFSVKFLSLVADVDEFKRGGFEMLLELAHITSSLEEVFRGSAELIFKNLFAFKISTVSALLELVTIVLVSDLKVV